MTRLSIEELKSILDRYEIDIEEKGSCISATKRGVSYNDTHLRIPSFCGGTDHTNYWAFSSLVAWVLQKEAEL